MRENVKCFKLFDGTVLSALRACLSEGYMPAIPEEVRLFQKKKLIPNNLWFDSGMLYSTETGRIWRASKKELENIGRLYKNPKIRARVLFVGSRFNLYSLSGYSDLDDDGSFLGIRHNIKKKVK